jgi:hypothetical protein
VGGEVFGDLAGQSADGQPDRWAELDSSDGGDAVAGASGDAGTFLEEAEGDEGVLDSPGELLVALVLSAFLTEDATTGERVT